MLGRIWTVIRARNLEFLRDRSALGWNLLFPFLIIIGFSMMFSDDTRVNFKVGLLGGESSRAGEHAGRLRVIRYVKIIPFESAEHGLDSLVHHRIDLLFDAERGRYWVSDSSPRGYVAERLMNSRPREDLHRESVKARELPYIEWLFPGILGMNMMFSALFGVGYVVVRYRKNGVLKRMSVTPLKPSEFLTAQVLSRMFLLLMTTAIVYAGCAILYGFACRGSCLTLFLVFGMGGFCMVSLGLLVACRSASEEFASGVLNVITWPMMFLSEVWFSMEGAEPWVQKASHLFPLTHTISAARRIMNDGAGLYDIRYELGVLAIMSVLFLVAGSWLFRWQKS